MTLAVFHDFPDLENGLTKFHDFPGRVVTLYIAVLPAEHHNSWAACFKWATMLSENYVKIPEEKRL